MKYLLIMIGSGTGGIMRYLLSRTVYSLTSDTFPAGTLAANLAGCFLIGLLAGIFEKWILSPNMRTLVFVGFLGGFTTFSSFGLETFNLLKDAEILRAVMNIFCNTVCGILLVAAGYFISHIIRL